MENFLLPVLLFSFWSFVGCLFSWKFLGVGFHRLFLVFLMSLFGCALLGRVLVLDLFYYPKNIFLSSISTALPIISGLAWPESDAENSVANEKLPVFCFGAVLLLINVLCTVRFTVLIGDHAVVPGVLLIAFLVGIQIFLMLWSIYFIALVKKI